MSSAPTTQNSIRASVPDRIALDIRSKIELGVWGEGVALPSRRELAQNYGVALRTIEQAMAPLLADGSVVARGSKGTFVASRALRASNPAPAPGLQAAGRVGRSEPVSDRAIGLIGAWTGQREQYFMNNLIAQGVETSASIHEHVTLRYFNRYNGAGNPYLSFDEGIEQLLKQGIDGLAILGTVQSDMDLLARMADKHRIPIVLFSLGGALDGPVRQITYEIEQSGYQAASHLRQRGWSPVVFLEALEAHWVEQRLTGARKAMGGAEFIVSGAGFDSSVFHTDEYKALGLAAGRDLFERMPVPFGLIAPNDFTAYGIIQAAKERGLMPGLDFGIVGFDDYIHSRECGLTTLRPPMAAMGHEAVQLLLRVLNGEAAPLNVYLSSELVARATTTRFSSAPHSISKEKKIHEYAFTAAAL